MVRTRRSYLSIAYAAALALNVVIAGAASAGPLPQTAPGHPLDPRTHAPNSQLSLVLHAVGSQKYTCQADGTWLFTDPEAVLYAPSGLGAPLGTHFLNFASGRPVWQLQDGSSVEAVRRADFSGGAGNIPWLLLQAVVTSGGSAAGLKRHNLGATAQHVGRRSAGGTLHAR